MYKVKKELQRGIASSLLTNKLLRKQSIRTTIPEYIKCKYATMYKNIFKKQNVCKQAIKVIIHYCPNIYKL